MRRFQLQATHIKEHPVQPLPRAMKSLHPMFLGFVSVPMEHALAIPPVTTIPLHANKNVRTGRQNGHRLPWTNPATTVNHCPSLNNNAQRVGQVVRWVQGGEKVCLSLRNTKATMTRVPEKSATEGCMYE